MTEHYDLIIVGGGLVGASMALAAARDNFSIALIEAYPLKNEAQPSFDERTIALTYSSYAIYQSLGIWSAIEPHACPITAIEVTNQNHWGFTHLGCDDVGTDALGYVVATRDLGRALYQRINEEKSITVFSPAEATDLTSNDNDITITIAYEENNAPVTKIISGKCTVVADGGRSALLTQLNLKNKPSVYDQKALVAIVGGTEHHKNKAFEHFMSDGPLALLPYRENDYALVWTAKEHDLNALMQLDDAEFLSQLKSVLGRRVADFSSIGKRLTYPLSIGKLDKPTHQRLVIIGNAAHIVHPVAGQGFNLGLRDVADLADVFKRHEADPGSAVALNQYAKSREHDTKMVSLLTDGLIKAFSSEKKSVQLLRNVGLSMINCLPLVKRSLLTRTMGIHKPSSRLLKTLK